MVAVLHGPLQTPQILFGRGYDHNWVVGRKVTPELFRRWPDAPALAVAPVDLGSGSRLWNSPDELLDRFHLEVVPSASGVTHHLFWRRCAG